MNTNPDNTTNLSSTDADTKIDIAAIKRPWTTPNIYSMDLAKHTFAGGPTFADGISTS